MAVPTLHQLQRSPRTILSEDCPPVWWDPTFGLMKARLWINGFTRNYAILCKMSSGGGESWRHVGDVVNVDVPVQELPDIVSRAWCEWGERISNSPHAFELAARKWRYDLAAKPE